MATSLNNQSGPNEQLIRATDHLDPEESVVRSGLALAEAVLNAFENHSSVRVSFVGLKGASSSYFNVFFRRIQEAYGLSEMGGRILPEFGSNIQRLVYQRSLEAIEIGPRRPISVAARPPTSNAGSEPASKPLWKRLLGQ